MHALAISQDTLILGEYALLECPSNGAFSYLALALRSCRNTTLLVHNLGRSLCVTLSLFSSPAVLLSTCAMFVMYVVLGLTATVGP